MASAVKDLLDILDLETLEPNLFRGQSPKTGWQRVYGGQVIGQALVAAVRTVDASRPPHSMHAYFILPGDPKVPLIYDVDRIRDGKSFTTRRVTARQRRRPDAARRVAGAARPHLVRERVHGGEPRPCAVAAPPFPRRRVAALRAGLAEPAWLARAGARTYIHPRRHPGRVGGPGRPGAPKASAMSEDRSSGVLRTMQ